VKSNAVLFWIFLFFLSGCIPQGFADTLSLDLQREGIVGTGIRALGMGGAFVHIADENPAYYNPAALLETKHYKLTNNSAFLFKPGYIAGNSSLLRINERIFFSLSIANDSPVNYIYTLMGGYVLPFGESSTLGLSGKTKIIGSDVGIGCDIGLIGKSPLFNAGIMVQDLMVWMGNKQEPVYIKLGIGFTPFELPVVLRPLSINLQGDFAWFLQTGNFDLRKLRIGIENTFFRDVLSVRMGYIFSPPDMYSLTAGAGLRLKHLSLNYAYTGSVYDTSHWFSVNFYFWPKTPEEIARDRQKREISGAEVKKVEIEEPGKIRKAGIETGVVQIPEKEFKSSKDLYIELLTTKLELEKLKVYTLEMEKALNEARAEIEKLKYSQSKELAEIRRKLPEEILTSTTEKELILTLSSDALFVSDSFALKIESRSLLDRIAAVLMEYPAYRINVEGHTDNMGSEEKNLSLSLLRAGEVAGYLMKKGLSEKRFGTITGQGSKKPVDSNLSEAGRAHNRRIEIIIYQ